MKALVFHIGQDRYALGLREIARVLPLLELKSLPLAPGFVAGLMDFHGVSVPVLDLNALAGLARAGAWFDSRIILIDYPLGDGSTRPLGLLAEHVLGVHEIAERALADDGVEAAPFLGAVAGDTVGIVQLIAIAELLTPDVRALLYQREAAA